MIFLSTLSFRKSLSQLLKAKREEYSSIKSDIIKVFYGKSPDEVFSSPDMIMHEKNFKIIKVRFANSRSKLSKRDGYRLIYLISHKKDIVCLFYAYPKTGSAAQSNISDVDLRSYVNEFIQGYAGKTLVCHNLINDLFSNKKELCNIEACVHEQYACIEEDIQASNF